MPFLDQSAALPGGYGAALLQTLLALGGVCLLAWLLLRFGASRGFGRGKRLNIIERLPLSNRHSIVLVEVDGEEILLGVGDGGPPAKIPRSSFKGALAKHQAVATEPPATGEEE